VRPSAIFALQVAVSLLAYGLIARWYLWPRLRGRSRAGALEPLLWPHVFRTLGLTMLVPGVVDPDLPRSFADAVALGDAATASLALLSLFALRAGWPLALGLVWLCNVVGTLDLLHVIYLGIAVGAPEYRLGGAWFVPTYVVPALAVSHVLMFLLLARPAAPTGSTPRGRNDRGGVA
jgi:hypothetical protein